MYTPRPRTGQTTYHRDGTVTVWDVLTQSWFRGAPPDAVLATLSDHERDRIVAHTRGRR